MKHTPVKISQLLQGTLIREGAGVKLQRYIGADRTNHFEPILLFDYFDSNEPLDYMAGFPLHPHRGFETITYLLKGMITHEDNKGNKGVIGPGDVQWMTAGRGIVHSEMPSSTDGQLKGLQLWLNLPATDKMGPPRYQEIASDQLPLEELPTGGQLKVIAGKTDKGTQSPIQNIATKPLFFDITLPKNALFTHSLPKGYQAILFVIHGLLDIEGQKIPAKTLATFGEGELLTINALEASQCLLIAAVRLHEPIVRHGPFVMNTQAEVMQALDDFRNNRF